ncbi:MAG: M48 family peptidase, partial [Gammaproteobacteria bacterium]
MPDAHPAAHENLPQLGSSSDRVLSVKEEQTWGDLIIRQLRASDLVLDDPLINEYIRSIGFKLVAANQDAAGRRFDFTVL